MKNRPDTLLLVYDADSGLAALLLDVARKALGREDCPLCEITYGPLGKRAAWKECEARLALTVRELHRDQLPPEWGLTRAQLPCILAQSGDERPSVLLSREAIVACEQSVDALERRLVQALERITIGQPG